jgi:cobalt-zinc-cadmium efflux system outer membrane protein
LTDAISHSRDWTEWQQRMALHRLMAETSVLQEKTAVYGKEMDAADRLLKAYRRQAEQGNASQVEVMRLEALKLRLMGEHSELTASLEEKKKELRQMLALPDSLAFRTDSLALAAPTDTSCEAVASRPDLLALQSSAQAAEHDLRLQRANGLPHIALKAEYDKNGNICRDFWGVGLSMTVPLLNRNQGQVRQSAKALERARLEVETATQRAKTELAYCYGELLRKQRLLDEAGKMSVATWQPDAAERSLLNHNLSMVEFIDLLDAWRESRLLLIDVRGEVLQAAINLNEAAGTDIVKLK